MEYLWTKITLAFAVYDLLPFLFYFFLGVSTCFAFLHFFFRKEVRLFRNLGRKIYLLNTGGSNLETERQMLVKNGLFSVSESILDVRQDTKQLQVLEGFAVFVLGYSNTYTNYAAIVDYAKTHNSPIVVFAKPTEITTDHMKIFQQHIYFEMCNTSARLLTTILGISLIMPYAKK